MKIIYDYQIFCLQKYGGISRYIFELVKNINDINTSDQKVNIIAPFYINKYINNLNDKSIVKGFKVKGNRKIGRILSYANKIISPILISKYNPDILHATYYFDRSEFARFKGKKILTIYDMIHELYPDNFRNSKKLIQSKKHAVKTADHIICISENTRNDLINILGVEREKTSVIHLGFLSSKNLKEKSNIPKNLTSFL